MMRFPGLHVALVVMVSLMVFPFISAQEIQEQVRVELVQVDLVATDSDGNLITDLTADDFVLKEEGKVQTVSHFYNSASEQSRYPLTLSFVVDTSYSMHEEVAGMTRIDVAKQAAEMVLNQLIAEDKIELIEFNNEPVEVVPFTSDFPFVAEKFGTLDFRKANTALHDSIIFALDQINKQLGRKIVVVFSDGQDSKSKAIEDNVVEAIRKSDATIITFYSEFAKLNFPASGGGLGGNPTSMSRVRIRAGEDALRLYAELSGGQFFSFRKEPELLKAMESFRGIINSQYTLAYTPPEEKKKSGWRKIKVECKRKGIKLRHREGYWAD